MIDYIHQGYFMDNAAMLVRTQAKETTMRMYNDGELSLGQASKLCGMDLYDFTALLSASSIPVINYSVNDFEKELDTIGVR
jgi:predicted HTH domain antitoxin